MVKAVVLYGPPEGPDTFERYYAETHTALAKAIPGLQRFEAAGRPHPANSKALAVRSAPLRARSAPPAQVRGNLRRPNAPGRTVRRTRHRAAARA
jgi:hypothetical protein